jgi:HD-like signal output (HDOD) protein
MKMISSEMSKALRFDTRLVIYVARIENVNDRILPSFMGEFEGKFKEFLRDSDTVIGIDETTLLILAFIPAIEDARCFKTRISHAFQTIIGGGICLKTGTAVFPDNGRTASEMINAAAVKINEKPLEKKIRKTDHRSLSLDIIKDGDSPLETFQSIIIKARGSEFLQLCSIDFTVLWSGLGHLSKIRQKEFVFRLPFDSKLTRHIVRAIETGLKPDTGRRALEKIEDTVNGFVSGKTDTVKLNTEKIYASLKRVHSFPTLPIVTKKIFSIARDPMSSVEELSALIRTDPSLTLKLLKTVNSAFYGYPKKIDSVNKAVIVLGRDEIINIAFGLAVAGVFTNRKIKGLFHPEELWSHLAGTAMVSGYLCQKYEEYKGPGLFTAGLLHDFGKIFLFENFPVEYGKIYQDAVEMQCPLYELEEERMGMTHAFIGKMIASDWNLPENLIQAVAYHHTPFFAPEYVKTAAITGFSDYLFNMAQRKKEMPRPFLTFGHWQIIKKIFKNISVTDFDGLIAECNDFLHKNADILQVFTV